MLIATPCRAPGCRLSQKKWDQAAEYLNRAQTAATVQAITKVQIQEAMRRRRFATAGSDG